MRLTLRTLLAYLDGNLEPDDAEDIGKKIEESEFATKLVHTIRDCTQRAKLGSPPLMGRGLGADPNTVAEYLEYRLADERVPEFERICLESEVNLAEVASCHQILTLVLGEPAEIDPHMRQRLYALAAQADSPPVQGDAIRQAVAAPVAAPPAGGAVPPVVRRAKPEVPDYLRESRWPIWPVVAVVLVAASLTFAGLFFFGPAPFRERMTALVAPSAEPAAKESGDKKSTEATDDGQQPTPDESTAAPADNPAANAAAPNETERPTESEPGTEEPPAEPLEAATPDEGQPELTEPAAEPGDASLTQPAADAAMETDASTAPVPPEPSPLDTAAVRPTLPPGPLTTTPAAPLPGEETPAEPMPLAGADAAKPRAPAEGFGRYTSREVLLKFDPSAGQWSRLPVQSPLNKGDRLMSLPLFHPTMALSSNITVQADGAAEFELVGWDDDAAPILSIQYGKLLMSTVGRAVNALRLQIDGHDPLVTFVDPESTLAIEVRHVLQPGKNPESSPAPLEANLYATSGVIRVMQPDAAPIELHGPAMLSLTAGPDAKPTEGKFPAWISGDELSAADRGAARGVDESLAPNKSAGLQLRELAAARRREVRTLAIRGLVHLGDYDPSITALNDPDLRHSWQGIMDELQEAIALSPETAARVEAAFDKQRGAADGKALYRMLWGYTTTDLQSGADRELIDALNRDDALDFRVLAFLNLQELFGATYSYRPEDIKIKRNTPYNRWKTEIGKLTARGSTTVNPPRGRPVVPPAQ